MDSKKKRTPPGKFWARVLCLILAGLMVAGIAVTSVFMIIDLIESKNEKKSAAVGYSLADDDSSQGEKLTSFSKDKLFFQN